jgi:hypothetical protein
MKIPEPKFLIVEGRAIVTAAEKSPAKSPAHIAMFELRSIIRSNFYPRYSAFLTDCITNLTRK